MNFRNIPTIFPRHELTKLSFLAITRVSELLGISISTINGLIKRREFPPKVKISPKRMVFIREQIKAWIDQKALPHLTMKVKNVCFINI